MHEGKGDVAADEVRKSVPGAKSGAGSAVRGSSAGDLGSGIPHESDVSSSGTKFDRGSKGKTKSHAKQKKDIDDGGLESSSEGVNKKIIKSEAYDLKHEKREIEMALVQGGLEGGDGYAVVDTVRSTKRKGKGGSAASRGKSVKGRRISFVMGSSPTLRAMAGKMCEKSSDVLFYAKKDLGMDVYPDTELSDEEVEIVD